MSDNAANVTVDSDRLGSLLKRLIFVSVVSAPVVAAFAVAGFLFDGSSGVAATYLVGVPVGLPTSYSASLLSAPSSSFSASTCP